MTAASPPPGRSALLVVSSLVAKGRPGWGAFYRAVELGAAFVPRGLLRRSYGRVQLLTGPQVSRSRLTSSVSELASAPEVAAVDVFFNLHGERDGMWCGAEWLPNDELRDLLAERNSRRNLRLAYNTSCYGDAHSQALISGGFVTAIGSLSVNTSAAYEYPLFSLLWARGRSAGDALRAADSPRSRRASDGVAATVGFRDVGSRKVLRGDPGITIDTFGGRR